MDQITRWPAPQQRFQLTYSPAHRPSGTPINPQASRNVLSERCTAEIEATTADAATAQFERDRNLMVTSCTRMQVSEVDL